jgi:hypothetical protein
MVEMVCEKSGGAVAIEAWRPGGQTAGHKADVPKVRSSRHGGELFWQEVDKTDRVPVEPDALFTLRFKDRPEEWLVLDPIWALPDQSMHALGDAENSTAKLGPCRRSGPSARAIPCLNGKHHTFVPPT